MASAFYRHSITSPIGPLTLIVDRTGAVVRINFGSSLALPADLSPIEDNKYVCGQLAWELDEYFHGKRTDFSLEILPRGSDFQKSIWSYLRKVPYGITISYGELARRSGRKGAARVVASAVANNPIPIIIPCHRILPAHGGIGLYALHHLPAAEGTRMKAILLSLEAAHRQP